MACHFTAAGATASLHSCRGHCVTSQLQGPLRHFTAAGATASLHSCRGHCVTSQLQGPLRHFTAAGATASLHSCRGHCVKRQPCPLSYRVARLPFHRQAQVGLVIPNRHVLVVISLLFARRYLIYTKAALSMADPGAI